MIRRLSKDRLDWIAAILVFSGVILGIAAVGTKYWTWNVVLITIPTEVAVNGNAATNIWNGLFQSCTDYSPCSTEPFIGTSILCICGILLLLTSGILLIFDILKSDYRHFATPLLIFVGSLLMTLGLLNYASMKVLNYHSSRMMIMAILFAFSALPLSAFVTGRFSEKTQSDTIKYELPDSRKCATVNINSI